ncbi:MAG TPA: DUF58 domain-containing protein [bacterium]|nr:DUF58 domain-containing protein [bacterium]
MSGSSPSIRNREAHLPGLLPKVEPSAARKFVIAIRRLADDLTYGLDGSRFLGSGIDYVQSRQYLDGDPVKSMDWRVTARTGKYHVKEYEAQRRFPAWFLLDTSASMVVSSTRRSKYETALQIAGGLALACLDRTSPVGVLGCGDRDVRITPSLSKDRVLQWLLRLRRFAFDERTEVTRRIRELRPTLQARSIIVLLSDLHEPGAVHSAALLAQEHEVAVIQVQDPAEVLLAGGGFLRAQEAESGRAFVARSRRPMIDQARIENELRKGGVDHLLVRTDEPYLHRLRHFFRSRAMTGGGR